MQGTTLTQHIRASQKGHANARGELTALLTEIGVAGKVISSKVNMAGLVKILGSTGRVNVQGEVVQKLDEYAEHTIQSIVGEHITAHVRLIRAAGPSCSSGRGRLGRSARSAMPIATGKQSTTK